MVVHLNHKSFASLLHQDGVSKKSGGQICQYEAWFVRREKSRKRKLSELS
jgi:hypothetical protein